MSEVPPPRRALYLGSQSPRRRQLLQQIGVEPRLLLADGDEDAEALESALPGELPAAYVQRVTALKLDAAVARIDDHLEAIARHHRQTIGGQRGAGGRETCG